MYFCLVSCCLVQKEQERRSDLTMSLVNDLFPLVDALFYLRYDSAAQSLSVEREKLLGSVQYVSWLCWYRRLT